MWECARSATRTHGRAPKGRAARTCRAHERMLLSGAKWRLQNACEFRSRGNPQEGTRDTGVSSSKPATPFVLAGRASPWSEAICLVYESSSVPALVVGCSGPSSATRCIDRVEILHRISLNVDTLHPPIRLGRQRKADTSCEARRIGARTERARIGYSSHTVL